MKKRIIVIATAARDGGAWRIVEMLAILASADNSVDYTFITLKPLVIANIQNIIIKINTIFDRIKFELYGIRIIINNFETPPDIILSLNNLAVIGAPLIKQYVYIHQAIPFYPEFKWGIRKNQIRLLFYQKFYGKLIWFSIRITDSKIIVQTETMAQRIKAAWGLDSIRWFPLHPVSEVVKEGRRHGGGITFLYPASASPHKNHKVLFEALLVLRLHYPEIYQIINLVLPIEQHQCDYADDKVKFIGYCEHSEIELLYTNCNALLFPSVVETVGLPLVEASALGLPILCSDTPFFREVLGGYSGVKFLPALDPLAWALAILQFVSSIHKQSTLLRFPQYINKLRGTNLSDLR